MAGRNGIWDNYADWRSVGGLDDTAKIRARITGLDSGHWTPNAEIRGLEPLVGVIQSSCLARHGHRGTVVDFGCGLGRNLPYLRARFDRVVGFDLPEMATKLRADPAAAGYDAIHDERAALLAEPVDVVYDSVVWQHIMDQAYANALLDDLLRLPDWRWVLTFSAAGKRGPAGERGMATAAGLLVARGWQEVLTVDDRQTFGRPHVMRVLRRPEGAQAPVSTGLSPVPDGAPGG